MNTQATKFPEKNNTPSRFDQMVESADMTDSFIAALLHDARSQSPIITFERRDGKTFVSSGFGTSGASIILTKDWQEENVDQHTIKLVLRDGSETFTCTDRCKIYSDDEDLRELYQQVERNCLEAQRKAAIEDVRHFIEKILLAS